MATIAELVVSVVSRTAEFSAGMQRARQDSRSFSVAVKEDLAQISSSVSGMKSVIVGAAAAIGVGLSVHAFKSWVEGAAKSIDETAKLADRLGTTTESLVGLRYAADLAGVGGEQFASALSKMEKNLGQAAIAAAKSASGVHDLADDLVGMEEGGVPAGKLSEMLARLGLSVQKLSSESPDQAFKDIADGVKSVQNPLERAAIATAIFGRGGQQLINVMSEGRAGIEAMEARAAKLGITFTRVDAKKVEEANDRLKDVGLIVKGIGQKFAIELAPFIERAANKLIEFSAGINVSKIAAQGAQLLSQAWNTVTPAIAKAWATMGQIGRWIERHRQLVKTIATVAAGYLLAKRAVGLLAPTFSLVGSAASIGLRSILALAQATRLLANVEIGGKLGKALVSEFGLVRGGAALLQLTFVGLVDRLTAMGPIGAVASSALEGIGSAASSIAGAFQRVTGSVISFVSNLLSANSARAVFGFITDGITGAGSALRIAGAAAVRFVANLFTAQGAQAVVNGLISAMGSIGGAMRAAGESAVALVSRLLTLQGIQSVFSSAISSIGSLGGAIRSAAGGVISFVGSFLSLSNIKATLAGLPGAIGAISGVLRSGLSAVISFFATFSLAGVANSLMAGLSTAISAVGTALKFALAGSIILAAIAAVTAFVAVMVRWLTTSESWSESCYRMARAVGFFNSATQDLGDALKDFGTKGTQIKDLENQIAHAGDVQDKIDANEELIHALQERLDQAKKIQELEAKSGSDVGIDEKTIASIKAKLRAAQEFQEKLQTQKIEVKTQPLAVTAAAGADNSVGADAQKLIEKLQDEIASFGQSAQQIEVYKLVKRGASAATLDEIKSLSQQKEALDAAKKATDQISSSAHRNALQEIGHLQTKGVFSQDDFDKAVAFKKALEDVNAAASTSQRTDVGRAFIESFTSATAKAAGLIVVLNQAKEAIEDIAHAADFGQALQARNDELARLNAASAAGVLTTEELGDAYRALNGAFSSALDALFKIDASNATDALAQYTQHLQEVRQALAEGAISQDDFRKKVDALQGSLSKSMQDRAKSIVDSIKTPAQKLQEQLQEIQDLFNQGYLNGSQAAAAAKQAIGQSSPRFELPKFAGGDASDVHFKIAAEKVGVDAHKDYEKQQADYLRQILDRLRSGVIPLTVGGN